MAEVEFPSNSNQAPRAEEDPQRKRVEKVANGTARPPRKAARIKEAFSGDDARTVGTYILFDVVIPATKTLISDMVREGVERMLFGGSSYSSRGPQRRGGEPRTNYSRISTGGSRISTPGRRDISPKNRATHDFQEVVLDTRGEAEQVLDTLLMTLDEYNQVTVSDLYDSVGITGDFTDDKWGWTDLRGAAPRRIREGYILELPKPIYLD